MMPLFSYVYSTYLKLTITFINWSCSAWFIYMYFIILFIFGCTGSSCWMGFSLVVASRGFSLHRALLLWRVELWHAVFNNCTTQAWFLLLTVCRIQAQQLLCPGLVAAWHVESSQTRILVFLMKFPVSPALAGGFLSSVPTEKSRFYINKCLLAFYNALCKIYSFCVSYLPPLALLTQIRYGSDQENHLGRERAIDTRCITVKKIFLFEVQQIEKSWQSQTFVQNAFLKMQRDGSDCRRAAGLADIPGPTQLRQNPFSSGAATGRWYALPHTGSITILQMYGTVDLTLEITVKYTKCGLCVHAKSLQLCPTL